MQKEVHIMDLNFITDFVNGAPLVVAGTLATGYVIKKWIKDVDNKIIPTVVGIEGAILNGVINGFSIETVIAGAIAGLASTGLHQVFKQIIEGNREDTDLPK